MFGWEEIQPVVLIDVWSRYATDFYGGGSLKAYAGASARLALQWVSCVVS